MINKNVIALGFVSFFTDMASSMVTTILPIYIVYILNEGVDKLGYIIAITTFVSYSFRILFGYLSDRYKIVKPFIVSGYAISALTKPLLYYATSWGTIGALRGVERIGKAIRSASKDSLISNYSEKNSSGKTFGFHKSMDIAGELVGATLVFLIFYYIGKDVEVFKNIFALSFIPGVLSVFIVLFFVKDAPYKDIKERAFDIKTDYKILPTLFIYFGAIFFVFDTSFYIVKAKEVGYGIEYIPLLVILLNFVQTLSSYYFGLKVDKFGSSRILLLSFVFGLISLISLYFNFIIISFIFLALFLVSSINSLRSYISVNATNKATVYGVLYGGIALSSALGAIVFGLIWQYFGESTALVVSMSGISVICIFTTVLIVTRANRDKS